MGVLVDGGVGLLAGAGLEAGVSVMWNLCAYAYDFTMAGRLFAATNAAGNIEKVAAAQGHEHEENDEYEAVVTTPDFRRLRLFVGLRRCAIGSRYCVHC